MPRRLLLFRNWPLSSIRLMSSWVRTGFHSSLDPLPRYQSFWSTHRRQIFVQRRTRGSISQKPSDACVRALYTRHICLGGATTPNPTDGITGHSCGFGGYCPAGATSKQPCLSGTYNPDQVAQGPADCVPCPPGYYCEGDIGTKPTGLCEAGFVCPAGASNPKQELAPRGHYSDAGASKATPCPKGTYNPNEGQTQCRLCDAGSDLLVDNAQAFSARMTPLARSLLRLDTLYLSC